MSRFTPHLWCKKNKKISIPSKKGAGFISQSEKQTIVLGKNLAKKLKGGEVIGLIGNLGAGKTVFIKGLAKGLGIKRTITSPSFVLMKLYKIKSKIKNQKSKLQFKIQNFLHIDCYRLENERDLIEIGVNDWLGKKDTITVIEWADRVKKILPKKAIKIKIKFGKKENERILEIAN